MPYIDTYGGIRAIHVNFDQLQPSKKALVLSAHDKLIHDLRMITTAGPAKSELITRTLSHLTNIDQYITGSTMYLSAPALIRVLHGVPEFITHSSARRGQIDGPRA